MKTRNTFLRIAAITVIVFVVMVTATVPGTDNPVQAEESANLGFIAVENSFNHIRPMIFGSQNPELRQSTTSVGSYELHFYASRLGVLEETSTMPVMSGELILRAYVADAFGVPAQSGTATFEYCSYKRLPPNDIERADEAPKEACDAGIATWKRLWNVDIGNCPRFGAGSACLNFGVVRIPRDVGFRFRFNGKRSGIDAG